MNSAYREGLGSHMPDLAREFFATFSRFEFALKRGGFHIGGVGSPASPDWNRFASILGADFFEQIRAAAAASVLFEEPPRKLVVLSEMDLGFADQPPSQNAQQLFEAMRLVRNNLFHGEKAFIGPRDEKLMTASLFVLDAAFCTAMNHPQCRRMTTAFAFAHVNPH